MPSLKTLNLIHLRMPQSRSQVLSYNFFQIGTYTYNDAKVLSDYPIPKSIQNQRFKINALNIKEQPS